MRFKLTVFLFLANALLAGALWFLERKPSVKPVYSDDFAEFTELEISGKNIDRPRVLKLENNRWRIVSPINWSANFYAVSHIRNQLEFLKNEASFSVAEMKKHGQSLSDFGLDAPLLTFKYGNGKAFRELKIGRDAPVGNRVYMLDVSAGRVIVADKSFVENMYANIDTLRDQNIFEIPIFEVGAFSVKLAPAAENSEREKQGFVRVGLVKSGGSWKFETPITADADPSQVDGFLKAVSSLNAKSFAPSGAANTGLDISSFPASITLQGTNRSQTLLLGAASADGKLRYARLEENPTVFLIDPSSLPDLASISQTLRSRAFFTFDENDLAEIDISSPKSSVKLKKLDSGVWDVIGRSPEGGVLSESADFAVVNMIIANLSSVRARDFVSDALGDDLSRYGLDSPRLKVSIKTGAGVSKTLLLGGFYEDGKNPMLYASVAGGNSVYGVPARLASNIPSDVLGCKSRIVHSLPESAKITGIKIAGIADPKSDFEFAPDSAAKNSAQSPREKSAMETVEKYVRSFRVSEFAKADFSKEGLAVGGKKYPFAYELSAEIEQQGTGGNQRGRASWLITKRVSGTLQYAADAEGKNAFVLTPALIDALSALTIERTPPKIFSTPAPAPLAPVK